MDERTRREMQPGVEYLYCGTCGQHVPCIPLGQDTWEVQCSQCVGDCGLCACHGNRRGSAQADASPDPHVHVAQARRERHHHSEEGNHE